MPRGRKAVLAEQDALNAAILGSGLQDFTSEIAEETGKIIVRVETAGDRQKLAPILAQISPDATIEVKPVAQPTAAPIGVQSGDYIYGGFYYYFDQQHPGMLVRVSRKAGFHARHPDSRALQSGE